MNFGEALAALKSGERIAREGWNGKGMWLVLVVPHGSLADSNAQASALVSLRITPSEKLVAAGITAMRDWLGAGPKGEDRVANSPRLMSFIGMKTADNGFVPWLASQTDLLAEDWVLAT